jgi:hypothetical protein
MPPDDEDKRLEAEFDRSGRREGMVILAFGLTMLALALYLANSDVPLLRQGRLLAAFVLGVAATGAGLVRLAKPRAFRDLF